MADLRAKAQKIKLVGTDIDGVWTDSRMYVTPEGDWMKAFSTYDGMAVSMLQKKGIIVAILTSENTDIVLARAEKLKIDEKDLDKICLEYIHGLNWIMNYYKQGIPSWDWYFPHFYAPFLCDIVKVVKQYKYKEIESEPLTVYQICN